MKNNAVKSEHAATYNQTEETQDAIIAQAKTILANRLRRTNYLTSPKLVMDYLILHLAEAEREEFGIIYLDNQHAVINAENLFYGTIDGASVYPREVVKSCLLKNAAACIFYHNHPSGVTNPSQADKQITSRLITALDTVDIRVLDHIIVGGASTYSFAENGLI